jgi:LDH2 family malate/lactate/ureidoglycolate dehydrogenase
MAEPSPSKTPAAVRIGADALTAFVAELFVASGISREGAHTVAAALVEADLQGLPSHGTMQAEQYLLRLKRGIVSREETVSIVSDQGPIVVIDGRDMLGQLSSNQANAIAIERAKKHGVGIAAVRNVSHFGAAGRYALAAAQAGCVGIVLANTRTVMPAPGGVEPLVGTNPLAIGVPAAEEPHIIFDMATSEGSVGKIRIAGKAGKPIPDNWALTADGRPTTDAQEALKGMLLPTGGAKGFGLSLMIDLLCGLLASGGWGDQVVGGVTGSHPHNASHLFIAMDIARFRPLDAFKAEASKAAERVRRSRKAPGAGPLFVPGERKWRTFRDSGNVVSLEAAVVDTLVQFARDLGVDPQGLTGKLL